MDLPDKETGQENDLPTAKQTVCVRAVFAAFILSFPSSRDLSSHSNGYTEQCLEIFTACTDDQLMQMNAHAQHTCTQSLFVAHAI